jgi:DNA-binding response OmpR family regulator
MKVLVADDDRVWVEILVTAFRKEGFEVFPAYDGMQATMVAMQRAPDAVVLDVQMPGGTGVDTLKRLKMSTRTGTIPIVVVSGSLDPNLPRAVKQQGATRYMSKPVPADDVVAAVRELLGLS